MPEMPGEYVTEWIGRYPRLILQFSIYRMMLYLSGMSTKDHTFKLGKEYPREGFVQEAIERYFNQRGYIEKPRDHVDWVCKHPESGDLWIIEAKGETTSTGSDFRTCLGQLVQAMNETNAKYGIAIPATQKYYKQLLNVKSWVRKTLNLHWILINKSGQINILDPDTEIENSHFK